jgi:hypothetical protein
MGKNLFSLTVAATICLFSALQTHAYIAVQVVDKTGGAEMPTGSTTRDGDCLLQEAYGCDIGGDCGVEHFQYAYIKMDGDFEVSMQVVEMSVNSDDGGKEHKCGIMARSSDATDARAVYAFMFGPDSRNTADLEYRDCSRKTSSACWDICSETGNGWGKQLPRWLKLKRTGNKFEGLYSLDGQSYQKIGPDYSPCNPHGEITMDMPAEILVGVASGAFDWWNDDNKWHIANNTKTCDFKGWDLGKEGEEYGGSGVTGLRSSARSGPEFLGDVNAMMSAHKIVCNERYCGVEFILTDAHGRVVEKGRIGEQAEFNLSKPLSPGMYWMGLKQAGTVLPVVFPRGF